MRPAQGGVSSTAYQNVYASHARARDGNSSRSPSSQSRDSFITQQGRTLETEGRQGNNRRRRNGLRRGVWRRGANSHDGNLPVFQNGNPNHDGTHDGARGEFGAGGTRRPGGQRARSRRGRRWQHRAPSNFMMLCMVPFLTGDGNLAYFPMPMIVPVISLPENLHCDFVPQPPFFTYIHESPQKTIIIIDMPYERIVVHASPEVTFMDVYPVVQPTN
ncbi:uncharacterized protein [Periplaneta americana]|uniref:uncharacterized protein n=1 Tax=Periplaneta americana TaxID=6978 RepID=UPI0037E9ACC5